MEDLTADEFGYGGRTETLAVVEIWNLFAQSFLKGLFFFPEKVDEPILLMGEPALQTDNQRSES